MGSTSTLDHLPEEIIEEILSNLPVKSLLRFKCVSKRWRFLISSKQFTEHHLKKSRTNLSHQKLIILNTDVIDRSFAYLIDRGLKSCSLLSSLDNSTIASFDRPPLMNHIRNGCNNILRRKYFNPTTDNFNVYDYNSYVQYYPSDSYILEILGSCNGLVLISVDRANLFVWNPTTRRAKRIAPPACHAFSDDLWDIRRGAFAYGFGHDEIADEYKIACVFFTYKEKPRRTATEIYSSRTGSWKKIEDFDMTRFRRLRFFGCGKFMHGKCVNGKLHWLTDPKECVCWEIVSLDLSEEKYGIVGRPEYFSNHDHYRPRLHELGGYLSLTSFYENYRVDVWVMTKYGETESWVRFLTTNCDGMVRGIFLCPLWLMIENGDIVVANPNSRGLDVVFCNGSNLLHTFRVDDVFADDSSVQNFDANIYVESLVSPFGDE
ncbi:hypothetical protein ACP275_14G051800 [Erythranthe tilingii]